MNVRGDESMNENRNVMELIEATVTEAETQSKQRMGRPYGSAYEAWAVLRRQLENAEVGLKDLKKLHGELWESIRDGNGDAEAIEMEQMSIMARELCQASAVLAGEATRAVEELE